MADLGATWWRGSHDLPRPSTKISAKLAHNQSSNHPVNMTLCQITIGASHKREPVCGITQRTILEKIALVEDFIGTPGKSAQL